MTAAFQLEQLIAQGMSPKDAAEALSLNLDDACVKNLGLSKVQPTLSDVLNTWKPRGISMLIQIAEDYNAENKDRIAAIKILLSGEGVSGLNDIKEGSVDERLLLMKRAMGRTQSVSKQKPKVVDVDVLKEKCYNLASEGATST